MIEDSDYNLSLLFHKIVKLNKRKIALRFKSKSYTFNDLDGFSNNYINFLKNNTNKVVAIFSDKNPDNYFLMIACIKIGIPYVNLDSSIPFERNKKILKNLNKPIVFVSKNNINVVSLRKEKIKFHFYKKNKKVTFNDYDIDFDGETTAYIMFTSGSTGQPKGAVITHSNLKNFIIWIKDRYYLNDKDNFVNTNPLYFDNSVFDFFGSIFNGCCLTPLTNEQIKDYPNIIKYIDKKKCTIWFAIPSMFIFLLKMQVFKKNNLKKIKILSFGGEGFPKKDLKQIFDLYYKRIDFINVYGPTECTCICSTYDVSKNDFNKLNELLPLGKINPNFSYAIKNGELILKGPNVGKGYFNNEKKTQENFFLETNNRYLNKKCYKTGDIVLSKKNFLYFKGRVDNQIKHMGYRIELEDIENNVNSINFIDKSVAIFSKERERGKIILLLKLNKKINYNNISRLINNKLPRYMQPSEIYKINKIPLNRNGKIDRKNLKINFKNENLIF
jgi:D-alanine--poly(phosphoribitol) ligase subunit 1